MQARTASGACPACGTPRPDRYCPSCGQRRRERLSTEYVFRSLLSDAVGVNRGLVHTFVQLLRDPARVVKHYMAGHTVSYTNPASYLLLFASITALLFVNSGGMEDAVRSFNEGFARGNVPETMPLALRSIVAHTSVFVALGVPMTALFSRAMFAGSGHNYAEHVVFNAYVLSHVGVFLGLVDLVGGWLVPSRSAASAVLLLVTALLVLAYYARAAIPVFGERLVPGVLRSASVLLMATSGFTTLTGLSGAAVAAMAANESSVVPAPTPRQNR
jgi:hypothetical protein